MKPAKIAAILFTLPIILASCTAPYNSSSEFEYIAVYKEAETEVSDTAAETEQENIVLPMYSDYSYLDHIIFAGDEICGGISEHGLLSEKQVLLKDDIMSGNNELISSGECPYVYLWYGGREIFSGMDEDEYSEEILDTAISIRDKYPECLVIVLGVSPAAEVKGGSDSIKSYNKAVKTAVKSCPDVNIVYQDTWEVLADSNGYLPEVYDKGDGTNLSRAAFRSLLSYIEENRLYNSLAGDMKYTYIFKDLYVTRSEYEVTEGKTAYLTFDDGPSKNTPKILDILDENNIKATFFITGWCIDGKEDILLDIQKRGHTIGVHSYSHDYDEIYASVAEFLKDFNKAYNKIYDITGEKPWLFRFPGGSYNNFNKPTADSIIAEMNRRGFTYYDWNAATADASSSADYDSCMEYLENSLYSDHSVVLMHDSLELTVEYLQDAIDLIKNEGYSFETLDTADPIQF
ncbi:MAG: polysaccharide deacetylase family protein [Huintestinicola sp.]